MVVTRDADLVSNSVQVLVHKDIILRIGRQARFGGAIPCIWAPKGNCQASELDHSIVKHEVSGAC